MIKAPKEWLTYKIAISYRNRSKKFEGTAVKERFKLIHELMERCGITELEATCIIRGAGINDYVAKYEKKKSEYMDILINGEKTEKPKRIRRKPPIRPLRESDPNQYQITSQNASGQ